MPMGIHKQAIEKNRQVEFERQAEEQMQQDFVYTPSRIKHLFTQASFYLDFKDKRSCIAFQVQLVNWQVLLFK